MDKTVHCTFTHRLLTCACVLLHHIHEITTSVFPAYLLVLLRCIIIAMLHSCCSTGCQADCLADLLDLNPIIRPFWPDTTLFNTTNVLQSFGSLNYNIHATHNALPFDIVYVRILSATTTTTIWEIVPQTDDNNDEKCVYGKTIVVTTTMAYTVYIITLHVLALIIILVLRS